MKLFNTLFALFLMTSLGHSVQDPALDEPLRRVYGAYTVVQDEQWDDIRNSLQEQGDFVLSERRVDLAYLSVMQAGVLPNDHSIRGVERLLNADCPIRNLTLLAVISIDEDVELTREMVMAQMARDGRTE